MKYGGGSIILWGCFIASRTGNLIKMEENMKKEEDVEIFKGNLQQSAEKLGLVHQPSSSKLFFHNLGII